MFISILIFLFYIFTSNGINPDVWKLILNFNFHYWMKIKWTKGTRTFMAFSAAVLFNYDGPSTKVVNFFEE